MIIQNHSDFEPYFTEFQWGEHRKDKPSLFIAGAEFQAHFLYHAGHTAEKRQALIECINEYMEHYGQYMTWGTAFDKNGKGRYVDFEKMPSISDVVQFNQDHDDQIEWYVASGERDEAPEYSVMAFTNRDWEGRLLYSSTLTFRVAKDLIFNPEQKQILLSLIQLCINKLGVYHAVAGFQGALPYKPIGVGDYSLIQSQRFWGIYQGANIFERTLIQNGIKSIDWLTYINNDLVQRICEVKTFGKYCEHFKVQPQQLTDGFLFLLENFPQLMPSNLPVIESYFNLNKALRPLRNGAYEPISLDTGNNYKVLDVGASRKWIRRLDAPDVFPDQGHYKEQNPNKSNLYLESGTYCEINGVYRFDEQLDLKGQPVYSGHQNPLDYETNFLADYRQHVVLLKGDIAPRFLEFSDYAVLKQAKKIRWHLVSEIVRIRR